jgi:hypothetical protein
MIYETTKSLAVFALPAPYLTEKSQRLFSSPARCVDEHALSSL